MPDEHLAALFARERAAFRAYLDALDETVRRGRELEAALDLLPLADRRDTLAAIAERIDHVHELRNRRR